MGQQHNYPTRYLGDANPNRKKHVHDLTNEKRNCVIHSLEWSKNAVPFASKQGAYAAGYAPCIFCLPNEKGAD